MMVMVTVMELMVMVMVTVVVMIEVMMSNAQLSLCPALSLALSDTNSFKAHRNPMSRYCYDSFSQMRKLSPLGLELGFEPSQYSLRLCQG